MTDLFSQLKEFAIRGVAAQRDIDKLCHKSSPETQCEQLLRHFRNGGDITSFEAYLKFGITQLGRCISDLEGDGHRFNRPRVQLENGKVVCKYSLIKREV